jgi:hypothetical protein
MRRTGMLMNTVAVMSVGLMLAGPVDVAPGQCTANELAELLAGDGIPDECEPEECPPGTIALVDAEGDFAGWCASTSCVFGLGTISVEDVDPQQGTAAILINKCFPSPPGFGGLITPVLIDFVQVCPDDLTADTIVINEEWINNGTGVDWTDFHWILFDGPEVWFDVAASQDFDTSPFADKLFEELLDANRAKRLSVTGGTVPAGMPYTPGEGTGELVIGVDLSGEDPVSVTLKERPTTDNIVNLAVASNVSGAPVAIEPADFFGAADGLADFGRFYHTGTSVTLTAPARFQGKRFVGWTFDGVMQPSGIRMITLTMSESTRAEAVYAHATIGEKRLVPLER